ncbi:MAG: hypothetical protein WC992_04255 [Acholeplasmataceae bacterium]|jgi:hypothetical protein|nr:hypothetical protein [Acholeplasmataceae bacterium]
MKETKSLKAILVFIVLFCVFYNLLINQLLKSFDQYITDNNFFVIRYASVDQMDEWSLVPQFMNWLLVVSFVFFMVVLILRIYINKEMKIKKRAQM